jgi:hypothetical protein
LHIEEIRRFGMNHTQVGAYLLGIWGMPVALVETAALHHAPSHTDTPEISVLTAVHAANVLAYAQRPPKNGIPLPPFDVEYLEKLGLPVDLNGWKKLLSDKGEPKPDSQRGPVSKAEIEAAPKDLAKSKPIDATGPVILAVIIALAIIALAAAWIISRR